MAKLFKNAIIGSETVYLVKSEQTPTAIIAEPLESTQPLIAQSQIQSLQQEAYQEGFLTGKKEGEDLVSKEMTSLKQQLETALLAIPQAIAKNRMELNIEIADIVLLITQQFFIEKEANPHAMELQINQLLAQLNNKQTVELYLHPQEVELLKKGKIQLDAAHLNGLKINSDENLALGGYVIKTNHGIFDASIEKQIDKLKEFLIKTRKRGQHEALD